jgi:hypothetical protein
MQIGNETVGFKAAEPQLGAILGRIASLRVLREAGAAL